MRYTKSIIVLGVLVTMAVFFSECLGDNSKSSDPRGPKYAGSAACMNCHKEIASSVSHTNHFKTSSAVNSNMLKKIVDPSKRYFYYSDSGHIRFEEKGGDFFQSLFVQDKKEATRKFDIAFGSGEKAQTYGGWEGDQLFQLPLTYYSGMNTWANSPGFPTNHAKFDRLIIAGCFQCHATYIAKEDVPAGPLTVRDKFYPATVIYGIDCERCHGPAAEHVKYQQENPLIKTAKYITSIKSLSRDQKLDMCATCHSGNDRTAERSIFAFVPGDTLSNYYLPEFGFGSSNPQSDVHGKQMQLLQSSKCFQKTTMTCGTCHDPHDQQRERTSLFITKCMSCHQGSKHALDFLQKIQQTVKLDDSKKVSCITCHMPLQSSKVISFTDGTTKKSLGYYLRTHRIAVYK